MCGLISLCSWQFNGDIGEGIKSIPYQLQRLFIHLQVNLLLFTESVWMVSIILHPDFHKESSGDNRGYQELWVG